MQLAAQPVRIFSDQCVKRLYHAASRRFQRLTQYFACFRFAASAQQQGDLLRQRHHTQQLSTGLLTAFQQHIQPSFGEHRLPLNHIEQRLLQFDMQWQLRMKFRWRRCTLAGIGLTKTRQPGLGQIGTALHQPQFALTRVIIAR